MMCLKTLTVSFLSVLFLISCEKPITQLTLNFQDSDRDVVIQDITLTNIFSDTIELKSTISSRGIIFQAENLIEGYYTLFVGEKRIHLYLTSDSNSKISLSEDDIIFSGDNRKINTYLKRKYSPEFNWYSNYYKTKQEGSKLKYFRDNYIRKLQDELLEIDKNNHFIDYETKELEYSYLYQLLIDKFMLLSNKDSDQALLNDLDEALFTDINNNQKLNDSKKFISIAANILVSGNNLDQLPRLFESIEHPNFKLHFIESLVTALHKELQFAEEDYSKGEIVRNFINKHYLRDSIGVPIFNIYDKFKQAQGKQVEFSYENVDGELISSEMLLGRYVYIDFWATWCANCIVEFPVLKELEKLFEDEPIEFIGISIDKLDSKEKWKRLVSQKELDNIQLIAPFEGYPDRDDIEDDFMKLLYVNAYYLGIPHYALIDPEGKVVDAYFYRPSNPKFIPYLSKLFEN